jgi:hypothetical protein
VRWACGWGPSHSKIRPASLLELADRERLVRAGVARDRPVLKLVRKDRDSDTAHVAAALIRIATDTLLLLGTLWMSTFTRPDC